MDLDKKAKEILNDKLNEHKHRLADALFGSTEEMVLDAIKLALTIPVVSREFKEVNKTGFDDWAESEGYTTSTEHYFKKEGNLILSGEVYRKYIQRLKTKP